MSEKRRPSKSERELSVLMALVEHYAKTGKPVGSHTLKEVATSDLSSATIRNYFASLESEGYLKQHHTSGGRVPTEKAYQVYLSLLVEQVGHTPTKEIVSALELEGKEVSRFLQSSGEWLSAKLSLSLFMSFPRFDQDYLVKIKGVVLDPSRILFALVTQFGEVFTEILPLRAKLSEHAIQRIEHYFDWRLRGSPDGESRIEGREVADGFYQELMLRYIVRQTSFVGEELFRCGLSELLKYAEFQDPLLLSNGLGLFENGKKMRHLLKEAMIHNGLKIWLGTELDLMQEGLEGGALVAIPYRIGSKPVGAFALLVPLIFDFRALFEVLFPFVERVSEVLTETVYLNRLSYRMPSESARMFLEDSSRKVLLEDKRK